MKNKISRTKEGAVNKEKGGFKQLDLFPGWEPSTMDTEEGERVGSSKEQERAEEAKNSTFGQLSVRDKAEAERRLSYVSAIESRTVSKATKSPLSHVQLDTSTISDKYLLSPRTIIRWQQRSTASRENILALVPSLKMRNNRCQKISADAISIINHVIQQEFLMSQPRLSTACIHRVVVHRIMQENKVRNEENKLALPSYRMICKMRRQVMNYKNVFMHQGKRSAYARTTTSKERISPIGRITESDSLGDGTKRGNNLMSGRAPPRKPGISKR